MLSRAGLGNDLLGESSPVLERGDECFHHFGLLEITVESIEFVAFSNMIAGARSRLRVNRYRSMISAAPPTQVVTMIPKSQRKRKRTGATPSEAAPGKLKGRVDELLSESSAVLKRVEESPDHFGLLEVAVE